MYLHAKRLYRKKIDAAKKYSITKFILDAKNPCKAVWNIINSHRKASVSVACMSSPDEINSYFIIKVVDETVGSLPNVPARGFMVYPAYTGVQMLN